MSRRWNNLYQRPSKRDDLPLSAKELIIFPARQSGEAFVQLRGTNYLTRLCLFLSLCLFVLGSSPSSSVSFSHFLLSNSGSRKKYLYFFWGGKTNDALRILTVSIDSLLSMICIKIACYISVCIIIDTSDMKIRESKRSIFFAALCI